MRARFDKKNTCYFPQNMYVELHIIKKNNIQSNKHNYINHN